MALWHLTVARNLNPSKETPLFSHHEAVGSMSATPDVDPCSSGNGPIPDLRPLSYSFVRISVSNPFGSPFSAHASFVSSSVSLVSHFETDCWYKA